MQENYVITDNQRILRVYHVQPLRHAEGMLMAHLPAEPAQVERTQLEVATLAPVHGTPVPWSAFQGALKTLSAESA